jgi:hypothetical protein
MVDYTANITSPRWTKDEENLLLKVMENYKDWSEPPYISIVEKYFPKRTVSSIKSKLKRIAAKAPKTFDFSDLNNSEKREVLNSYLEGNSPKYIKEQFGLESLEAVDYLCNLIIEPLREMIRAYAEEHSLLVKEPINIYKLDSFLKLRNKSDQFSKSALKKVLNG